MSVYITEDDKFHKEVTKEKTKSYILGDSDKKWIQLPKQLGGKRVDVIEKIKNTMCKCGKHITDIYILDSKYSTMNCKTMGQWMWVETPNEEFRQMLREYGTK